MIHGDVLRYRGARYLWWALALCALAWLLYSTQGGAQPPNGGTWQGYVLGTLGALLIVWLTLLGIRKRSYGSTLASVKGWTSAHVYLGLALAVIATLHSAAQLGWNVHGLAYVLMLVVIASGLVGLGAYLVNPRLIAETRQGSSRAQLFAELSELDARVRELAARCSPAASLALGSSIERTTIGGGALAQLLGRDRSRFLRAADESAGAATLASNVDQQAVIDFIADRIPRTEKPAEVTTLQQAVVLLCRRQAVLRRIRRDIRLQGWLEAWLYVHVPLTVALLVALLVHILTTFIYW